MRNEGAIFDIFFVPNGLRLILHLAQRSCPGPDHEIPTDTTVFIRNGLGPDVKCHVDDSGRVFQIAKDQPFAISVDFVQILAELWGAPKHSARKRMRSLCASLRPHLRISVADDGLALILHNYRRKLESPQGTKPGFREQLLQSEFGLSFEYCPPSTYVASVLLGTVPRTGLLVADSKKVHMDGSAPVREMHAKSTQGALQLNSMRVAAATLIEMSGRDQCVL